MRARRPQKRPLCVQATTPPAVDYDKVGAAVLRLRQPVDLIYGEMDVLVPLLGLLLHSVYYLDVDCRERIEQLTFLR